METTKEFTIDTPIIYESRPYGNKLLGYATIKGNAAYDLTRVEDEFIDPDYADINITNVRAKIGQGEQDVTFAYILDKGLLGSFADCIEKAVNAHMPYLFSPDYDKYEAKDYTVIATATNEEGITLVTPEK